MIGFRALGPLEVTVDGRPVRIGAPKQRALLGVLLVHAGTAVSAERLIDQLWDEDPPPTATTALQVHASQLRKVLGDLLVTVGSGYALQVQSSQLDVLRFEAAVREARVELPDRPAQAARRLTDALALWHGEPFGEVPATPDVVAALSRLAELRLSALEDRAGAELALGRHAEVAAELAAPTAEQPTRERPAELRVLALYRTGRPAEALRAYHRLGQALRDELGVGPGPRVAALAAAVERRDPTLDPPSPVPVAASRFIGRRRELEELGSLLGRSRLLTVTGPGGAGKTRLALELARNAAADHPDGVHVVELAALPASGSVATWVAGALRVRGRPEEAPADAVARWLGDSRALLVLDNCEHLTDQTATLCADLLTRCGGLRVLTTSREPLGAPGEQVRALTGLALPRAGDTGPAAAGSDALRLLADRGVAARRGFTVHSGNLTVAAELCRRLDGLPLAIELAAAQLRAFSLEEVVARLNRLLNLTDRRARTAPERHRTMRAAIDWSYHLLDAEEQAAFRRLSVFAGGCVATAAELVCELADGPDLLVRLVDRSMLVIEPHPDGTRFRMLDLIAEYAAERLAEAGETAVLRHRHAAWCAELAAAAGRRFGGPDQAAWLRRLSAEEANLRAALDWCLSEGADPATALSIASPLWWFWWSRGLMVDALGWLRRGLAASPEGPPTGAVPAAQRGGAQDGVPRELPAGTTGGMPAGERGTMPAKVPVEVQGRALRAAAALARNSGDHATARELGERCLALYCKLDDPAGMAAALNGLCITTHAQRDFAASLRYGEQSRRVAEEAGDERGIAAALNNMGLSMRAMERREEATALCAEALERFRGIDDPRGEAGALSNLAILARRAGNLQEGRALALTSLQLYRDLNMVEGQLDMLDVLAALEFDEGRPAAALCLLTVAGREREQLGAPLFSPDEIADRDRVLARARAALGPRAAAVADRAAAMPLPDAVDRLLP